MPDLRKIWNVGSIIFSLVLPFALAYAESSIRAATGDAELGFLPPELVSATLSLLLLSLPVGERPEEGTSRAARRAARAYTTSALVTVMATILLLVGLIVVFPAALGYSIKGTYPLGWPKWQLTGTLGALGPMGIDMVVYYFLCVPLAIVKIAKPPEA